MPTCTAHLCVVLLGPGYSGPCPVGVLDQLSGKRCVSITSQRCCSFCLQELAHLEEGCRAGQPSNARAHDNDNILTPTTVARRPCPAPPVAYHLKVASTSSAACVCAYRTCGNLTQYGAAAAISLHLAGKSCRRNAAAGRPALTTCWPHGCIPMRQEGAQLSLEISRSNVRPAGYADMPCYRAPIGSSDASVPCRAMQRRPPGLPRHLHQESHHSCETAASRVMPGYSGHYRQETQTDSCHIAWSLVPSPSDAAGSSAPYAISSAGTDLLTVVNKIPLQSHQPYHNIACRMRCIGCLGLADGG